VTVSVVDSSCHHTSLTTLRYRGNPVKCMEFLSLKNPKFFQINCPTNTLLVPINCEFQFSTSSCSKGPFRLVHICFLMHLLLFSYLLLLVTINRIKASDCTCMCMSLLKFIEVKMKRHMLI